MKFMKKYPYAKCGKILDNSYLVSDGIHKCIICGQETRFIEICSEAYFCDTACEEQFYEIVRANEDK